jgi:hypothetical protein
VDETLDLREDAELLEVGILHSTDLEDVEWADFGAGCFAFALRAIDDWCEL